MATYEGKNPNRVAAGLKASLQNPNVSEEAKERAADRLESLTATDEAGNTSKYSSTRQEDNRVLGGYKATLRNERTSDQAKEHAREVLEASGYSVERAPGVSEDEHETRVIAGYKAALHNPRVSQEAKQHAQAFLEERGAL
ncbi:hypothetical protein AcW1_003685 [Taiwanofungus camphoratus]|nr:hypothetical protein AcV5_003637 [Antrodia cinnamomea]KAI0940509.1 hypothetical protein AcW1_003685 [Antrodia cinnamomea]KAI0958320.1 hypothetical protein AcV7_004171 [Antrodia cinnamomea]